MKLGAMSAAASAVGARAREVERQPGKLQVAVVQFRSSKDVADNVRRHCDYLHSCAGNGARVVVFPECSATWYHGDTIPESTLTQLDAAESRIAATAKEAGVYAIFGMPTRAQSGWFNSAVVVAPSGRVIERYHKVQVAGEKWATPGDHMSVFPIDNVLASIIVCHDERYPELMRLPVIAGARLVFYISYESGLREEHKIAPYRSQIVARAVENNVYVAHANGPAEKDTLSGSHGQSRIIAPDGNILVEASIFEEEVIEATLDLSKATGALAKQSVNCEFLRDWWKSGVARVRICGG